jgi:hypothetical protein
MAEFFRGLCGVANYRADLPAALGEKGTGACSDESGSAGYDDRLRPIDGSCLGLLGDCNTGLIVGVERLREKLAAGMSHRAASGS